MKRFILILLFSLLLIPAASAQVVRQLNISVDVLDDTSADVSMSMRFTEEIKELIFPIEAEIENIETQHGECFVSGPSGSRKNTSL